VSPGSRSTTAQVGTAAGSDSATITLTGDGSSTKAWTAAKKKAWTTLTTASGTGSAKVKWNRSTTGLSAGTYVDTITVSAAGVSPRTVIDTLVITAAPVPLAMSVSPTSRSATAQAGSAVGGDSATVTVTGDGSSTKAWTAAKKKAWTTLTAASGTGSAKVKWNRSTSGLSAGTYVDTITVAASGLASRTIIDTLVITAAPVPLAMSVSPTSRTASAQVGAAAPGDNATVTLTGTNSSSKAWTASKKKAWTTLTTASGTGNGTVEWNRSTSGLSAGTYVDTITVSIPAGGVSPRIVIDTLVITAAPVPLAMSVSPTSRSKSAQAGTAAGGDSANVTLTGDGSSTKAWTASKKKAWTTLTTASGTGSGKVKWNRSTSGLSAGTYVDTIIVSAAGVSPRIVIDTLVITPAPVPLAITASATGRRRTIVEGSATYSYDTVQVSITGTGASTAAWSANKVAWRTQILTPSGNGSIAYRWRVAVSSATPGIYTDVHTVALTGVPGGVLTIADTVVVVAAPVPLAMNVTPSSRYASAQVGLASGGDSAMVTLSGDGSTTTAWTATKKKSWTTLSVAGGTGSGTVKWNRNTSGLTAGTYVDTLTVAATGLSPRTIIDTLVITSAPPPLLLAVSPGSVGVTVPQGATATGASAAVTLSGTGATSAVWTATKKKSWTTLTTANGTGSGVVAWTRATAALAAGTHVDTITVSVAGLTPKIILDSIVITPSTPIAVALLPNTRRVQAVAGSTELLEDEAAIEITGTGAPGTTWFVTKRRASTTILTTNGLGEGALRWRRNPTGLAVGHHVDTLTVIAGGASAILIDTLTITAGTSPTPPTPPVVASLSPASRLVVVTQQNGWSDGNGTLALTGTDAATAAWTVAARKAHTSLVTTSGTGPGAIQWRRRLNGLAPGTYVDTITVTVASVSSHAIIDSLIVLQQTTANLSKRGGRTKVMQTGNARAAALGADTTSVSVSAAGDAGGGNQPALWVASTTAPWIRITSGLTPTAAPIQWERELDALPLGRHIDSVVVALSSSPTMRGVYVDTVDVISVAVPTPTLAVEDLARGGKLTGDQRDLFDAFGNRNGRYDLGDFLAWVDRNQIVLTGSLMQSVAEVRVVEEERRSRARAQVIARPESLP
jgi:hypothetical protein